MVFTCEMSLATKRLSVDLNLYSNLSIRFSDLERTPYHKHKLNTRGNENRSKLCETKYMFYRKILSFLSETKNARVIEVYKIHERYCLVKKKRKELSVNIYNI